MKIDLMDFLVFSEGRFNKVASLNKVSDYMDSFAESLLEENRQIEQAVNTTYEALKSVKPQLDCLVGATMHTLQVPPIKYSEMKKKVEAYIRQHFIVHRGKGGCLPK